jgi:hypothetical protein
VIQVRERLVQLPVGALQGAVAVDVDRGPDVSGYLGEGNVLAVEAAPLVVELVQWFYLLLIPPRGKYGSAILLARSKRSRGNITRAETRREEKYEPPSQTRT